MSKHLTSFHAIEETIIRGKSRGSLLIARNDNKSIRLIELAKKNGITVSHVSINKLNALCNKAKHRGVILLLDNSPEPEKGDSKSFLKSLKEIKGQNNLVILLDRITDPQNFGAILRSADQFSVDIVVVTSRNSVKETNTVISTSQGASNYVKISIVSNLSMAINLMKQNGFWVFGAHLKGEHAERVNLNGRIGLVLGSEGRGLHPLIQAKCDGLVMIPASGHIDSFNVSVAAGILMYEVRRQQCYYSS